MKQEAHWLKTMGSSPKMRVQTKMFNRKETYMVIERTVYLDKLISKNIMG